MTRERGKAMSEIEKVLMRRDGMTEREAKKYFREVREEVLSAIDEGDYDLAEDIMSGDLGLEMDYIVDLLIG